MRTPRVLVASVLLGLGTGGCVSREHVVRVIDGRPVAGELVPAEAYAAYLRGAIADAAGDLDAAIEGYAIAATLGPRDPEPLARLGDARCRRDPRDASADALLGRALAIDEAYAPALEARARCAERRGQTRAAVDLARRAAKADPSAVEPLATLARLQLVEPAEPAASEELRGRLMAMTLVAGTDATAWEALATWARGHGDALLESRALGKVAELAAADRATRGEIDDAVRRLAGGGEIAAARSLARQRVEAGGIGPVDGRIARLAIDDALVSGDAPLARRLATRSGVPLVVVAARALLVGDQVSARSIASMLSAAEPDAVAPRLVSAATGGNADGALVGRAADHGGGDSPLPPDVWVAHLEALLRGGSAEAARAFAVAFKREPLVAGDSVVTPLAVALAAAGALDARELDANGAIELAERRAEPAPAAALGGADARHRLLALARSAPRDPETIALARTLAPARMRDPLVAVAFARLSLAGAIDVSPMGEVLSRLDPADPIVAAAALDCAVRAGDARAIPIARARLAAVAHTAAERARVE